MVFDGLPLTGWRVVVASMTETRSEDKAVGRPICVLGMHRSGTSLVTRLINLLGVELGPEEYIVKPAPDNPRGFWEQEMLTAVGEEILARLGGSWDEPPDFSAAWEKSPELADLRELAKAIYETDFAPAAQWVWKDPRTCLTLPFWQEVFPPMQYVVCVRKPSDVAQSLQRRNGFAAEKSGRLWLMYYHSALTHTSGEPRLVVLYEDVVRDWQTVLRRLARFIGRSEAAEREDVRAAVAAYVNRDPDRSRTSAVDGVDRAAIGWGPKALYHILRVYARSSEPAKDGGAALQRSLGIFEGYCRRTEAEIAKQKHEVAALRRFPEEQGRVLEKLAGRLEAQEVALGALRAQVDELKRTAEEMFAAAHTQTPGKLRSLGQTQPALE